MIGSFSISYDLTHFLAKISNMDFHVSSFLTDRSTHLRGRPRGKMTSSRSESNLGWAGDDMLMRVSSRLTAIGVTPCHSAPNVEPNFQLEPRFVRNVAVPYLLSAQGRRLMWAAFHLTLGLHRFLVLQHSPFQVAELSKSSGS